MHKELIELIEQYKSAAILFGEAIASPNNKKLVRNANKIKRLIVSLRLKGEEGHQALVSLLDHEDIYIKHAASLNLLKNDTDKAIEVVKQIVDSNNALSGYAEMTLDVGPDGIEDDFLFWRFVII